MPTITKVTFYSSNPQLDEYGKAINDLPPEVITQSWEQVKNNTGFSLSSGESLFTELIEPNNPESIRVVNGFYFGSGKYGALLGIQYTYDDDTDGWISSARPSGGNAENSSSMVGNWIKGLTYEEIITHENWKGQPLIGLENDYIDFSIQRMTPDIELNLNPIKQTVYVGAQVTFDYSVTDYCEGALTGKWTFNGDTTPITEAVGSKTFTFEEVGTQSVQVTVQNMCGQKTTKAAIIDVKEKPAEVCELSLKPTNLTIRLGHTATFDAIHPYAQVGEWLYDSELEIVERQNKRLIVKPKALGSYTIKYTVGKCTDVSTLYVLEAPAEGEYEDPVEPAPPALPDAPPDKVGKPSSAIDLVDASKPILPLYMYPNIMKRNVRYRGHRESEKMLNDHQEQIYDIRQLYRIVDYLEDMKGTTVESWFNGIGNFSISKKEIANVHESKDTDTNPADTDVDSVRVLEDDVIQLSGDSFENRIVGIYGIKRRMQGLDERIAEAERRYKDYENAYE
jgi:PKD repeat protein